ncbi:MAG: tetratricopeptide repeat protein, partial [Woeseia sp.]
MSCDELSIVWMQVQGERIIDPLEQKDCFDQALGSLKSGDAKTAASVCDAGLKAFPGDGNLLCLAAKANLALKRFIQARDFIEEAIRLYPDFADAHETFGDLLFVQGHGDAAIQAYKQSLRLDPTRSELRRKRDRILEMAVKGEGAPAETSRLAGRLPQRRMDFQDEIAKAITYENEGEQNKAEDIYRDILKRDPDHVEAARLLAAIAVKHDQHREAEVFLLRAVKNAPDYGRAWVDLCNVQRELEKFEEAEKSANEVLRLGSDMAESHMVHAGVMGMAGRHEEAIASYAKALEIDDSKFGALSAMAHQLKTIGRQDEAIVKYRESIAKKPDHTEAYWSLANLKTYRFEESEIEAMEALLADADLKDESRVHLYNALGFAYESRGDCDRAFSNFDLCSTMRRQAESYDPVQTEDQFDRTIEIFDGEFVRLRSGDGCADDSPIFIVGLPRSGSTLLEQILSSH